MRPAAALGLLLALPLLLACNPKADEHASTDTDVRRAEAAWRDPWLAPADVRVPTSGYGSNGLVVRFIGERQYVATGAPLDATLAEARAAVGEGWTLVGATCGPRKVVAQLTRGDELDTAVLGAVVAERSDGGTEVTVAGQVPHHADGSWPALDVAPLDPDSTCLTGGSASAPLVEIPQRPTSGKGESGPDDFDGWRRDHYTDEEKALLADLATDPWIVATVPDVDRSLAPSSDLRTGDSSRFGVYASGELPARGSDPRAAVAAVVATMPDWEPTWASCSSGPTGVVDVRLRRVTDAGVATVRLLRDASSPDVQWQLNTPLPEGPDPTWVTQAPALTASRCLSTDKLPAGITVEGEPVALPAQLQPVP